MSEIIFSTGDVKQDYKVIGIIYAASVKKYGGRGLLEGDASLISNKVYNNMLDEIYIEAFELIKTKAEILGADAVIHVKMDIEQLTMHEQGVFSKGNSLRMQMFASGTAVSFV